MWEKSSSMRRQFEQWIARKASYRLWMIGAACLVHIAGCTLFDTREPQNPVTAGSLFEPPTSPTIVLRNLEAAVGFANANDYRRCFSDSSKGLPSFSFFPSIQGISADPAAFTQWGIREEEEYARNLFAELESGKSSILTFYPSDVSGVPIGDSIRFSADYTARFPHIRAGAERVVEGTIHLTFRRSRQNEWYITYWQDVSRSDKPSWSLIKARFIDR